MRRQFLNMTAGESGQLTGSRKSPASGPSPRATASQLVLAIWIASAGVCFAADASPTNSQPLTLEESTPELPWERASLAFGGYFSVIDSSFAFSPGAARETIELNAEDLLGLESDLSVFRLDALFRPGKRRRHQIDFSYASYRRSGEAMLAAPIDIGGGITLPATTIYSVLNFDIIRTGYSYAFVQSQRVRLGGGLSIYILPIEYGLTYATGDTPPELEPFSFTIPVPALTLNGEVVLVKNLYLRGAVSGFHLSVSGFEGTLFEAGLALEYRFWKHFALGLGYSGTIADIVTTPGSDYPGADAFANVNVNFHGGVIYGKLTF